MTYLEAGPLKTHSLFFLVPSCLLFCLLGNQAFNPLHPKGLFTQVIFVAETHAIFAAL